MAHTLLQETETKVGIFFQKIFIVCMYYGTQIKRRSLSRCIWAPAESDLPLSAYVYIFTYVC